MRRALGAWPVGTKVFAALAAYFVLLNVVYTATAYGEWAGTVLLGLAGLLAAFIALELFRRPEDERAGDASPAGGGPTLAAVAEHEPPTSSLPSFVLAAGMVVTSAGLPLGVWIILPGLVLVVSGVLGMIAESAR
ncbi:MAG: hypothetical protein GEV08_07225 [Acidimicrobiia bacterium]|nr:hypothetical protein [Acidimicrobiia bacterium]